MHIKYKLLALGCLLALPFGLQANEAAPATEPQSTPKTEQIAPSPVTDDEAAMLQKVLDTWMNAVASHKIENVLPLYSANAVLLPTVAPRVHEMPEEREEYFKHFTAKPNLKGVIDEVHFRMLGKDAAVASGLYTFSFTKDGQTVNVPARFTFVYQKQGKNWEIVEHHSSKTPE